MRLTSTLTPLRQCNSDLAQYSQTPSLHHSITPSLHHSITPSLQHSNTPSLHHSITPSLHHFATPPQPIEDEDDDENEDEFDALDRRTSRIMFLVGQKGI
jgi:hypothetical protein